MYAAIGGGPLQLDGARWIAVYGRMCDDCGVDGTGLAADAGTVLGSWLDRTCTGTSGIRLAGTAQGLSTAIVRCRDRRRVLGSVRQRLSGPQRRSSVGSAH